MTARPRGLGGLSRRDLLRGLGLSVVAAGCNPTWVAATTRQDPPSPWPDAEPTDLDAFPEGLMAGPPTQSAMELWSRYVGSEALALRWSVWTGAAWEPREDLAVELADGGYVHPLLEGLSPDQPVAAQLVATSGAASAVVMTRTAPLPEATGRVRVLATSCSEFQADGYPALDNALTDGPFDVTLWAGDTIYADGAASLDDFRAFWTANFSSASFRNTFAAGSQLFTWDDHEVVNDWDPESVDPALVAAGRAALLEHTPRPLELGAPDRGWYRVRYGAAVEFFVLDCRGERSPERGEYISPEQLAWLIDGLSTSTARFKCIVNSVPIGDFPGAFDVPVVIGDRWEGYPAQRDALLAALAPLRGVLFLSGDFHMPAVLRVQPDGPSPHVWEVVTGALSHRTNPLGASLHLNPDLAPNIAWVDAMKTATELEFDDTGYLSIRFVAEDGTRVFEGVLTDGGTLISAISRDLPL